MQIDKFRNIPEVFFDIAGKFPEEQLYYQIIVDEDSAGRRKKTAICYKDSAERVKKIAAYLKDFGLKKGDKVAIIANTRSEWLEIDLGILSIGGIVVSIYQSLPATDIAYILFDSEAEVVFAENQEQVDKILGIQEREIFIPGHEDRKDLNVEIKIKKIISIETLSNQFITSLSEIYKRDLPKEEIKLDQIEPHDIASLVYTSGTSGPPKGVVQTHFNHLSNIRQSFDSGIVKDNNTMILFLPLAHSFAKLMGYIGFLSPVKIFFPAILSRDSSKITPISILRDIKEINAEIVPIVPRFLEKMKEGIESLLKNKKLSSKILQLTINSSQKIFLKKAKFLDKIVFTITAGIRRKLKHKLFGNNFLYAISGGAKLPLEVGIFFNSLGITVFEGYGLTETCVATNVNTLAKNRIGTVGQLLAKDIEIKIAEDSEILFRGPNISLGYYKRPTATKASWDDEGWFHTGDLGTIEDGFLKIIGRKKEIIVTSGGKKISPLAIEDNIKTIPFVSQAILIGDNRPFCLALITLKNPRDNTPEVIEKIKNDFLTINSRLASFETIKNFLIIPEEFTVENGMLTPTFKIKRKEVESRYQKEIEELYLKTKR